ncbi:unnamed protein product [Lampetra planeri]
MAETARRASTTLEVVLGVTAGPAAFGCNPTSGVVAYAAGCVVVLLDPSTGEQRHIINPARKPITALAFSPDGAHLATGEAGAAPCICVWRLLLQGEWSSVAVLGVGHQHGVACTAFSPDGRLLVSVGRRHDQAVNLWDWKSGHLVATNKVSSHVLALAFSSCGSRLVTAGVRHVRFWLPPKGDQAAINGAPLPGRAALLGLQREAVFCAVACGQGPACQNLTYCLTLSGCLCVFDEQRVLCHCVDLQVSVAKCLCVDEELVFCGGANGLVVGLCARSLRPVCTLPRPSHLDGLKRPWQSGEQQQDEPAPCAVTVAVCRDARRGWLGCLYGDRSVYVWADASPGQPARPLHAAHYHAGGVRGIEVNPELWDLVGPGSPPQSSFLTCSSDSTVRMWGPGPSSYPELLWVFCSDGLCPDQRGTSQDRGRAGARSLGGAPQGPKRGSDAAGGGVRCMRLLPGGHSLALGDHAGNISIVDLKSWEETLIPGAHTAEVLCLDYTRCKGGEGLLVSAGRDRVVRVFRLAERCGGGGGGAGSPRVVAVLEEHSSPVTAARFAGSGDALRLVSCGPDRSLYFRSVHTCEDGLRCAVTRHVVVKETPADMDVDSMGRVAVLGCLDRMLRVFSPVDGRQRHCVKGSSADEGTVLKVHVAPSGTLAASSCSDKSTSIVDLASGACLATFHGHSEVVTSMKFSSDCQRLMTAAGDSCVFVWRLGPELVMRLGQRSSPGVQQEQTSGPVPPALPAGIACSRRKRRSVTVSGPFSSPEDTPSCTGPVGLGPARQGSTGLGESGGSLPSHADTSVAWTLETTGTTQVSTRRVAAALPPCNLSVAHVWRSCGGLQAEMTRDHIKSASLNDLRVRGESHQRKSFVSGAKGRRDSDLIARSQSELTLDSSAEERVHKRQSYMVPTASSQAKAMDKTYSIDRGHAASVLERSLAGTEYLTRDGEGGQKAEGQASHAAAHEGFWNDGAGGQYDVPKASSTPMVAVRRKPCGGFKPLGPENLSHLDECRQLTEELASKTHAAVRLYQQTLLLGNVTEERRCLSTLLREGLREVAADLRTTGFAPQPQGTLDQDILAQSQPDAGTSGALPARDPDIAAIVQQHFKLLLQLTQEKLHWKHSL